MKCPVCNTELFDHEHCSGCGKLRVDLNIHGRNIGSQNGEAGIIQYLMDEIGTVNKTVLEIGFGKECNSVNLLSNLGWSGWLIDQDPGVVKMGTDRWSKATCIEAHVTKDNINRILKENKIPKQVDVLSIDVDGIDYYLWERIYVKARLVVIEYNASFGPDHAITVEYEDDFNRFDKYPSYHGASLQALVKLGDKLGYRLVGCEGSGVNAFFLSKRLKSAKAKAIRTTTVKEAWYPHRNRQRWQTELVAMDDRGCKLVEV